MTAVALSLLAASGVHLLYTGLVNGWRGVAPGPAATTRTVSRRGRAGHWLAQAGLGDVQPAQFAGVLTVLFVLGAGAAFALFGGLLPALVTGGLAATFPFASARARRQRRRADAAEAWPRVIEEIRLQTGSLGRSIPQSLFAVGARAPVDYRPAFTAAEREWLLTTDFSRTVTMLKALLADATADVTLETLLVAHEVGGSDLDRRLEALVDDRVLDVQGRKDARAKQSGVRFARRFVLVVPVGMALAGLSIGTGRGAYQTPLGQLAVVGGITVVGACWVWAGRLMRLPEERRVFTGGRT
jgi:tight adherence protein B